MQCGHLKRLVLDCIFSGGFPPRFCSRNGAFKMQCGHLKRLVLDCIFSGGFLRQDFVQEMGPAKCNLGVLKGYFWIAFFRADSLQDFVQEIGASKCDAGRLKRLVLDCMFSGGFPPRFCSRNGAFKMQFGESKGRSFGLKLGAGFLRQDFVQDVRPSKCDVGRPKGPVLG